MLVWIMSRSHILDTPYSPFPMMHTSPPSGFAPRFTIVGCCIDAGGKILILKRALHKPQGGTWGLPAGKVDPTDKNSDQTCIREVFEETGIQLEPGILENPRKWYVVIGDLSFIWICYHVCFSTIPEVTLHDDEHTDFGWHTIPEMLKMDLIDDLDGTLIALYKL